MDLLYHGDTRCGLEQGELTEAMLEERLDMESKEELTRVQLMSKVSNVVRQEYNSLATKISRNVLTKLTAGPLGWKSSEGKRCDGSLKHQTSEDVCYEQHLALMHAMKESQKEELDDLRLKKLVKTRVSERRMKTRANHMFNRRLFVKPSSNRSYRRKGGILVTGVEQENETVAVNTYVRQESQIFVENFFRNPSRNRRVLQRLNSTQIQRISDAELRNQAMKMARAEEQDVSIFADDVELDGIQTGLVKQDQKSKVKHGRSAKVEEGHSSKVVQGYSSIKHAAHRARSFLKHTHLDSNGKSKRRKIKGGFNKYQKKKHGRQKTAILKDMVQIQNDVVEKKKVKKRSNRGKVRGQFKLSDASSSGYDPTTQVSSEIQSAQFEDSSEIQSAQVEDKEIQPPYPSPQMSVIQERDVESLPSNTSMDTLTPTVPQYSSGPPCPTVAQYLSGPPSPIIPQSLGGPSFSDDDTEEDFTSESETKVLSENDFEESLFSGCNDVDHSSLPGNGVRLLLERSVTINSDGLDVGTDHPDSAPTNQNVNIKLQRSEERRFVSNFSKKAKLSKKASSHDSPFVEKECESAHSCGSNFGRYYSSPQLSSDVFFSAENVHQETHFYPPTHHTPHGFYSDVVVEVDPISVAFQQVNVAQDQISEVTSFSTQTSYQTTSLNGSDTFKASFASQEVTHMYKPVSSPVNPIEVKSRIPAHAFKDTNFLRFIDTLDHKPTEADYISYQLRMIGDQIDVKYDDKLNHALDAIFMEVFKNKISWETFSMISRKLLLEGQKMQDGIFLITCFGRRLAELTPQFGDTVTGFTHAVLDKYASNLIMNFGGWGQLVQSYNQVEASTEEYQFDYEDYSEEGYYPRLDDSNQLWYDDDLPIGSHANPRIPSLNPVHVTNQYDNGSSVDLIGTSSDVVIVTPPPTCAQRSDQETPHLHPPRLRRVVSVEVLCSESDHPIEPVQSDHHGDARNHLNRSLSIDFIHTSMQAGMHCHGNICSWKNGTHECNDIGLVKGDASSFVESASECPVLRVESRRHSRHGSDVSVCSSSSIQIIHFQNGEEFTSLSADSGGGHIEIVSSGEAVHTNGTDLPVSLEHAPPGDYLDLSYDTPHPAITNNNSSGNNGTGTSSPIVFPLATAAILTSAVALGFVFLRRFRS